jgi:hypothetical protein
MYDCDIVQAAKVFPLSTQTALLLFVGGCVAYILAPEPEGACNA